MRNVAIFVAAFAFAGPLYADLERVEVGGEIKVRFRAQSNYENGPSGQFARMPERWAPGRPIGSNAFLSRYRFDDYGHDRYFAEMLTRLSVTAGFTGDVSAVIDFDSYDAWGEDFRSDYLTGLDSRADTADDLELIQGYVQVENAFGYPLRLRAGRQGLRIGNGWLVGDRYSSLRSLSFDGVRATYAEDGLTIDAWWAKLAEESPAEADGDVDFYGVHGTYGVSDALKASLFWMWVRDGRAVSDVDSNWLYEGFQDLLGRDDYDVTSLHTVGLRLWGAAGRFDYDLNAAYQFGDASQAGAMFVPDGGLFGDDDAAYDNWAGDLELGYTFDFTYTPRLYLGGAVYEGEDNRDISLAEWLCPFDKPEASVSFNRLFAHTSAKYSEILDGGQVLSNFVNLRGGVDVQPMEKMTVRLEIENFWAYEAFERPLTMDFGSWKGRRLLVPIHPVLSFCTEESSDNLGLLATLIVKYAYTEALTLGLLWEHFLPGRGVVDGNFVDRYGTLFMAGTDDDACDRVHLAVTVRF